MLYLVRMDVDLPSDLDADELAALKAAEQEYSQTLQRTGVIRHIWRVAGAYANYSVLDVESHDALHDALAGLPMFAYITTTVVPLAQHPNAIG